jgi:post-segregation antitoxin (ccd killing protein)
MLSKKPTVKANRDKVITFRTESSVWAKAKDLGINISSTLHDALVYAVMLTERDRMRKQVREELKQQYDSIDEPNND